MDACGSKAGWGDDKQRSPDVRFPEAVAAQETASLGSTQERYPCRAEEPSSRSSPAFLLIASAAFLRYLAGAWLGAVGLPMVLRPMPEYPLPERACKLFRVAGPPPCERERVAEVTGVQLLGLSSGQRVGVVEQEGSGDEAVARVRRGL